MNKRISIISLVFLLLTVKITAQVYPVSTTTTVSAPYPTSLSGFVDDLTNKVTLTVNVLDATLSGYPVKLRMVLKSNSVTISTSDSYITEPLYINGGEALVLTSSDLENYFRTDNVNFSGYSKNQYLNSGQLPDGVYQLSFQVIDYARDVNISSTIPSFLYIYVNDPPSLNLPLNKTTIEYTGSQSIAFNWSFLHSPYSRPGFSPSYIFELWEIYPSSLDPSLVVLSSEPVYTEELTGTSLNYTILNPLLTAGYKYAWRVQVTDPDEITEFKEDGYSDVYWFQYGVTCDPPELSVESVGADHINVEWETEQAQSDYTVRYRPTDQEEVTWYSTTTDYLSQDIESLRSNTEYIIQVQGQCGTQESGYSESVTASTKMDLDYQCGETDDEIDIENEDLLTELSKGTHITAGDFDVEIYSVEGNNGVFDGKGYILVPLFNFIKLEANLNSISVNTDYQMVSGNIKSVYNLENSLTINISGGSSGSEDTETETNDFVDIADEVVTVSDSVTSVTVSGDKVIITTSGNTTTAAVDSGKIVAITTSDGDQYVVDGTTNTVYTSSSPSGSAPASNTSNLEKESSPTYDVSFEAHSDQSYGFDAPSSEKPTGYFNYQTGSETLKPWKSIEAGQFDKLNAVIDGTPIDSLYFSRESLSMVMESSTMEDDTKQLLITGQSDEDTDELYAWYTKQENDSADAENYYAGSVDLISYEKESLDLCLVSVNGSIVPNAGYVQTYLNSIYKQAVVEWNVTELEGGVTVELSQSDQTVIDNTDDDDNMDYTSDMKLVIKALKKLDAYDKNTVYLFMADGATDESILGYMPLKNQFGFIFKFKSYPDEYLHTIAHEVAHGPFRLRHTFSDENDYQQTQATTNNLMDYSGADATDLYKYQWDLIHDPESIVFASLEDEDEGAYEYKPDLLLSTIYEEILKKNSIFHLSDIWDNESLVELLKQVKPYLPETFFVKDNGTQFVFDEDRYLDYIGTTKETFTQEIFSSLNEEQIEKYELARTIWNLYNDIFYSYGTTDAEKIKKIKKAFYYAKKKELGDTYSYTWVDGQTHDFMDPRAYYKNGGYKSTDLEQDIKDLILLMNQDWIYDLSEEKLLQREERFYSLYSMFMEYMYYQGVYELSGISNDKIGELREGFKEKYINVETGQSKSLLELKRLDEEAAARIKQELLKRLADHAALKAYIQGLKDEAMFTIVAGSAALVSSVALTIIFPPAGLAELALTAADIGFTLATIGEGIWKYSDINKGLFDDDKKYNVIEGVICNVMGDKAGSVFFNLASIGVSGLSIRGNIKNINELTSLKGIEVKAMLVSINNHTDTFTIAGSTYKVIYEIKTNN